MLHLNQNQLVVEISDALFNHSQIVCEPTLELDFPYIQQ